MENKNLTFYWIDRDQAIAAAARLAILKIKKAEDQMNLVSSDEVISTACKQVIKNKTLAKNATRITSQELEKYVSDTKNYFNTNYQ